MRKTNSNKDFMVEMKGVGDQPNPVVSGFPQGDQPRESRTNSSLVVAFEELRGRMNTRKLADDSRRVTRKSKGLNPDAPRPKAESKYLTNHRSPAAKG